MSGASPATDWRQVRLVLGVRWRVLLRAATSSPGRLALALLGLVLQAGLLLFLSVAAGLAMRHLVTREGPELADAALHAGFLVTFAWLAVSPAIGLRGSEFLDVTKLLTLPVAPRTLFAATFLGLATAPSVVCLVVPLAVAAVVRAAPSGLQTAAGLAAVALVAALGVLAGQTLLFVFLDVFRSRKWRDLSVVIATLLSASIYAAVRFGGFGAGGAWRTTLTAFAERKDWFLVLPSWWGAHAATGTGAVRLLPLAAAVPVGYVLFRFAARVGERIATGEVEEPRRVAESARGGLPGWVARTFPGQTAALVAKDLSVLGRDPSMRLQALHNLTFAGIPVLAAVWRSIGERDAARPSVQVVPLLVLGFVLATLPILLNPLGSEGTGAAHVLTTPVDRRRWVLGKALALVVAIGGASAVGVFVLGTAIGAVSQGRADVAAAALGAVEALAAVAVAAGAGAVVGVLSPTRTVTRDKRALRQSPGGRGGCVRALFGLAATAGVVVLLLPLALVFHLPAALGVESHAAVRALGAVAFAGLWGTAILGFGAYVGGKLAAAREEALVAELTRNDG